WMPPLRDSGEQIRMPENYTVLYAEASLACFSIINEPRLANFTERHKIELPITQLEATSDIVSEIAKHTSAGLVLRLEGGVCDLWGLRLAGNVLRSGLKVWFYWPHEQAVECIDAERLQSYRRLWSVAGLYRHFVHPLTRL